MNDSLTAGLLSRLDLMTAKLGIGAHALWSLWLASWWRPMLSEVVLVALAGMSGAIAWWVYGWAGRLVEAYLDAVDHPLMILVYSFAGGMLILLVIAAMALPDVIAYAINHQLYALDQLRALVGR